MQALLMSDVLKAKSVFLVKMVFSKIPLIQMTIYNNWKKDSVFFFR